MSNSTESDPERITRQSKDILNKNGYSFQYTILNELKTISKKWRFYGAEIPVSTRGKNTHIDFVLHDYSSFLYLVGECKRVQPSFADWVFVKTPYNSRKNHLYPSLVFDTFEETRRDHEPEVIKSVKNYSRQLTPEIYGLGFRVKKHLKTKEVECQDSVDVINSCVEQVLRSTSGLINLLSHIIRPSNLVSYNYKYYFLPVIFTSANLWITDTNISEADLQTGNLSELKTVKETPYIWFNYNRPRELSPEFREFTFHYNQPFPTQTQFPTDSVLKEFDQYGSSGFEFEDFTRSVLIINSSNLSKLDIFNEDYLL